MLLKVENFAKTFYKHHQPFQAVKDVSFELEEGKILTFLGPNGAGKTTTIKMLLGLVDREWSLIIMKLKIIFSQY